LGEPTSAMSKQQMTDMIDLILSFGNEHNVAWSDESD